MKERLDIDALIAELERNPPPPLEPLEELSRLALQLEALSDRMFELAEEQHPGIQAATDKIIRRMEELEQLVPQGAA